jgi:hypothetical protein
MTRNVSTVPTALANLVVVGLGSGAHDAYGTPLADLALESVAWIESFAAG